ncbi:DMT family transporter [Aerococcus sanguinicola]|uniref:DMT family transporter n=1 Tax=Aerococcus sanguinicola TaxID=119206 RepID=UPI00254C94C8|nr:DMT family transporter [Aerococcus sanguinicola]MDK7050016.1 DMT family transporter [Aerococcus sanguinicola]
MTNKTKGIFLAAFGASMWGFSGILAQIFFEDYGASSEWLVSCLLVFAGLCLLAYAKWGQGTDVLSIFKNTRDRRELFLFALLGMLGVQYLFFKTIEGSGAGMAAILQFTSPIFIYAYLVLKGERSAKKLEVALVASTILGVVLLVTRGQFDGLSISPLALITGLGSAVAVAYYTLQPRRIQKRYGSTLVVAWGMLLAGLAFQLIQPLWLLDFTLDGRAILLLLLIISFGTAFAFLSYLSSTAYINPGLANLMTALEPLLASILSVLVLGQPLNWAELLGIALVIVSIMAFSRLSE